LVTLASPLGGHPAAAKAAQGPVVIPSWRDVDPVSPFMRDLRRRKLPTGLEYHLLYAFGNEATVKLGENSDGVVPLSSQLNRAAQEESTVQFGCNDTHTGILANAEAVERVIGIIASANSPFPEDHLKELFKGGYDLPLVGEYSPLGRYCIRFIGHWLAALAEGRLAPLDDQQKRFQKVVRGEAPADSPVEKGWLRFIEEYPVRERL
jgi:Protein of unknown function, DUF